MINLQCDLTWLGPKYDPLKPYLLLSISAAFDALTATDPINAKKAIEETLRPWTWSPINAFSVYSKVPGAANWTPVKWTLVPAASLSNFQGITAALDNELSTQLDDFQTDDFIWDPLANSPTSWTGRKGRDWRSYLGHIATWPGGIGTRLNLTFFLVLDSEPEPGSFLVAAPIIKIGHDTWSPLDPNSTPAPLGETAPNSGLYKWTYDAGATALLNPAGKPLTNANMFIDVVSLWGNPTLTGNAADWTEGLDDRLAEAFDGVERLLEWARPNTAPGAPIVPLPHVAEFENAVYQMVRAVIDANQRPPRGLLNIDPTLPTSRGLTLSELPGLTPLPAPPTPPAYWTTLLQEKFTKYAPTVKWTTAPSDKELSDRWNLAQNLLQQRTARPDDTGYSYPVLIDLIIGVWAKHFLGQWTLDLEKKMRVFLVGINDLHHLLLLHNIGSSWTRLLPAAVPPDQEITIARTNVKTALEDFGKIIWAPADTVTAAGWKTLLDKLVNQVVLLPEQVPADSTSEGIVIQIDRVQNAPATPDADAGDALRQVSGVGVLLRCSGDKEWHCLNMANVQVLTDDITKPYVSVDGESMAVPYRLGYEARLRRGFVQYINQPLVAKSPWADLSTNQKLGPTDNSKVMGLLFYDSPYAISGKWQLERLVYGYDYDAAPFYFGNGGALPAEIAGKPNSSLKAPWAFQLPLSDPPAILKNIPYRRRCLIGPFRFEPDERTGHFPPEVPNGVYPIVHVLQNQPPQPPDPAVAASTPPPSATPDPNEPLLLLVPSASDPASTPESRGWMKGALAQFRFQIRPPSVDVKVWDRSVPDGTAPSDPAGHNRGRRKAVIQQFHDSIQQIGGANQPDATLDDPAVAGFSISGSRLWPLPTQITIGPSVMPASSPVPFQQIPVVPGQEIKSEQKTPIPVVIQSTPAAIPTFRKDSSGSWQLSVPNGQAWRFSIQPVLTADAKGQFDADTLNEIQTSPTSFTSFLVEVAAPLVVPAQLPQTARSLRSGVKLTPPPSPSAANLDPQKVPGLSVTLDPAKISDFAPLIHRTELKNQRWRWDGRPVYHFAPLQADPTVPLPAPYPGLPFDTLGPINTTHQDGILFSNRDDSDAGVSGSHVEFVSHGIPESALIGDLKWPDKHGVIYYRIGVRVFSRYEGLLDPISSQAIISIDSTQPLKSSDPTEWLRYVKPCDWTDRVPQPAVKVIVPLTESLPGLGGAPAMPGWLVVLDEAWYGESMAGLGERLESEIVQVQLPDADETRWQFGPDGIVEMPNDPYPISEWRIDCPQPVGAIGSTFDTDTQAPLFFRSAFIQPPPLPVNRNDPAAPMPFRDLSFYFVKLRFRRVITGSDANQPQTKGLLFSDWTDPYWVQILPPSDIWLDKESATPVSSSNLRLVAGSGLISINDQGVLTPVNVRSTGPSSQPDDSVCRFEIYALITRLVSDTFGRKDQEAFNTFIPAANLKTASVDDTSRVRLVEIQFRLKNSDALPDFSGPGGLSTLCKELFNYDPESSSDSPPRPGDVQARIVRVSPPIPGAPIIQPLLPAGG